MATTLKGFVAERLVDRELVEAHKERMFDEVHGYCLRKLQEWAGNRVCDW